MQIPSEAKSKQLRAESLRVDLAAAVSSESYEHAASLRDELALLLGDAEVAVLVANQAFYSALRSHDLEAMTALWPDSPLAASCTRTFDGFPPLRGRQAVLHTWAQVFSDTQLAVTPDDVRCSVLRGGLSAVVTCVERRLLSGGDAALTATNVFEKDASDGQWRLVLHQAWPYAEEVQVAHGDEGDYPCDEEIHYDDDSYPGATG